jgi:hypothetical protein
MGGSKDEQRIFVRGKTFRYIKDRLNGGKVFVNQDNTEYLRTADPAESAGEVCLANELRERGFPVPELLATGMLEDGTAYYVERSVGDRIFGDVFREETRSQGRVSDASFDDFVGVIKRYCAAQFDPNNITRADKAALGRLTEIENVMRNNPPSRGTEKMFAEAHDKACRKVMSLPWGYVQYDFNPFNVLRGGVIDFEFAGLGPVGYDAVTGVHFGRMWPRRRVAYVLTTDQIESYLTAVDEIAIAKGVPAVSSHANDFLVLKAIWATSKEKASEANPLSNPDFWEWRVKMRDWCIERYLRGEMIDSNRFEDVATNSGQVL